MIPANTAGEGGTVVVYGTDPAEDPPPGVPVLEVYADLRCPYCKRMDRALGTTMQQLADDGQLVLHYHFATFLDRELGGHGSHRALNALGAAANTGQRHFMAYLHALYRSQPRENSDGFAEERTLLGLASEVPGLRSPEFENAVLEGAFHSWVERVSRAFDESGVDSTPTVRFADRPVHVLDRDGHALEPEEFTDRLRSVAG